MALIVKDKISNILFIVVFYFYFVLAKMTNFLLSKKVNQSNSILYLTAFFPGNSGYEWRANKWAELLKKEGNEEVEVWHAFSAADFYNIKPKYFSLFLLKALHKRFWQVIKSRKYKTVIVRRELLLYNDYGNLFLDKLLLKIHPNAILDFDDDISYAKNEPRKINSLYGKLLLENGNKFKDAIKLYSYFIAGSNYLKEYALNINTKITADNILVLPTCVDYEKHSPKVYDLNKQKITFGWVGGNHNLFLLDTIIPALNKISKSYDIELLVIAGKDYKNAKAEFTIVDERWNIETEIESIKKIDVGLMPLTTTLRDKGKCSFKLIQYMGLGIVSVATNVGMNQEVINQEKEEGFLTDNIWEEVLENVIQQKNNWSKIGLNARRKVLNKYIFTANIKKLQFFINKSNKCTNAF